MMQSIRDVCNAILISFYTVNLLLGSIISKRKEIIKHIIN